MFIMVTENKTGKKIIIPSERIMRIEGTNDKATKITLRSIDNRFTTEIFIVESMEQIANALTASVVSKFNRFV